MNIHWSDQWCYLLVALTLCWPIICSFSWFANLGTRLDHRISCGGTSSKQISKTIRTNIKLRISKKNNCSMWTILIREKQNWIGSRNTSRNTVDWIECQQRPVLRITSVIISINLITLHYCKQESGFVLTVGFSVDLFFSRFLVGIIGLFTFSIIGMLHSVTSWSFDNGPLTVGVGAGISLFALGISSERCLDFGRVCGLVSLHSLIVRMYCTGNKLCFGFLF